jgi:hypothetical protein
LAGEVTFQWGQPCAASDLVHFRHRLGEDGIGKLFALSIALHKDKVNKAKEVIVDTTVQEKNTPSPLMLSSTRRSLPSVTASLKAVVSSFATATGLWYNACTMPNVMPTWLGMLNKPSGR